MDQKDENEKLMRELAELQKNTEPRAFQMVMDVARDCAKFYPARVKKFQLRLVSRNAYAGLFLSVLSSNLNEFFSHFCC